MNRGTFLEHAGRPAVRFECTYAQAPTRVWRAITDPAELAQWFPSRVQLQPRVGATIEFSGDPNIAASTGTVLDFAAPHSLGFTWGAEELHFTLSALAGGKTSMVLLDLLETREAAARNAAGWSVCLAELAKLLGGEHVGGPHGAGALAWRELYDSYLADGMPSGAPIPTP